MSSPLQLSDLPVGNLALSNNPAAVLLMRVSGTDYQVSVAIIRNINLQVLGQLPNGTPVQSDLMLVNRFVAGVATNFQVTFGSVGFPRNTKMWFYNTLPPAPNWSVVKNTGGNLLAVTDSTTQYFNTKSGSVGGTWQQTPTILTIDQIPAHNHNLPMENHNGSSFTTFAGGKSGNVSTGNQTCFTTGGVGSNRSASNPASPDKSFPATNGHNHGNTWRPMANVGIIGNKDF